MSDQKLHFLYRLRFPDARIIEFPIEIDAVSCTFISPTVLIPPSWTELNYQKCSNCPLHETTSPFCPVAINLISILNLCSSIASYQKVSLEVVSAERTISADTTMQSCASNVAVQNFIVAIQVSW